MNRLPRILLVVVGLIACLNLVGSLRANLVLHFSADDVLGNGGSSTPNDGDPVPLWKDLVGTNDAQPGLINPLNPTNPPLYRNAPAGPLPGTSLMLNGKPTVQFGFNVNNGTGLDSPFRGAQPSAHPQMTVVWVAAGDVANDYHPFWTFDGDTGGHHRSAGMWHALPGLPGTPVIPIQYDPCCGTSIILTQNAGMVLDAGGPQIRVPAVDPLLGGDATWHVFAARFDFPNKFQLIIDGHVLNSTDNEQVPNPDLDHMLALGYLPAGGGKGNNLRMLLSDFRIYDNRLSNTDMNQVGMSLASAYGLPWTPITVPEPATATLMVLGLVSLLSLFGRRTRKGS
jgi:hypothetical protein